MFNSENFYASLEPVKRFLDLASDEVYVPVPVDWYVITTDIVASTQAIQSGRYKDVNLLGASSIIAALNIAGPVEIPFMFGGDGASMLVPPRLLAPVREAVLSVQKLAQQAFDLELRVGVVPVADIVPHACLQVAKFQVTPNYGQASFLGGGITYATELVKTKRQYQLTCRANQPPADLTGLECRWQDIPSPHGHTLSLIVKALPRGTDANATIYAQILESIRAIYGSSTNYHPVSPRVLKLTFNPRQLNAEIKARAQSPHGQQYWRYYLRILAENLLGWIFMTFKLTTGNVLWGNYKQDLVAASDYQKIDDALCMVIAGTPSQTTQLCQLLDHRARAGDLAYGLHVSDRALMTCMIFDRDRHHVHLIDGADGGYALAAQALKAQLHRKAKNWQAYTNLLPQRRLAP